MKPKYIIAVVVVIIAWPMLNSLTTIGTSGVSGPIDSHGPIDSTLPPAVDMVAAKVFIRLGFGLDQNVQFQSTEMLTPPLSTVDAQQLISMVGAYNNFDGKKVAAAFAQFRGQVSNIRFGREGSPVIYINLPYWTHQREERTTNKGERISFFENRKLESHIRKVFTEELEADEFSVSSRQIRIWWD